MDSLSRYMLQLYICLFLSYCTSMWVYETRIQQKNPMKAPTEAGQAASKNTAKVQPFYHPICELLEKTSYKCCFSPNHQFPCPTLIFNDGDIQ